MKAGRKARESFRKVISCSNLKHENDRSAWGRARNQCSGNLNADRVQTLTTTFGNYVPSQKAAKLSSRRWADSYVLLYSPLHLADLVVQNHQCCWAVSLDRDWRHELKSPFWGDPQLRVAGETRRNFHWADSYVLLYSPLHLADLVVQNHQCSWAVSLDRRH